MGSTACAFTVARQRDPGCAALASPLRRYARESWTAAAPSQPQPTDALTVDELNQAFAHAAARARPARWRPASPIEWAIQGARAALASQPNVIVAKGPLAEGWERGGAFDAIFVDGASEVLPEAFRRQLKDGGRLVCVLGGAPQASAMLYRRSGTELAGRAIFDAAAAPLPGFAKTPVFAF